jgi:hypothetical protein
MAAGDDRPAARLRGLKVSAHQILSASSQYCRRRRRKPIVLRQSTTYDVIVVGAGAAGWARPGRDQGVAPGLSQLLERATRRELTGGTANHIETVSGGVVSDKLAHTSNWPPTILRPDNVRSQYSWQV